MDRILAATLALRAQRDPDFSPTTRPPPLPPRRLRPGALPRARRVKIHKKAPPPVPPAFKTEDERTFYAYGYRVGQNLATTTPSAAAEANAIAQGLKGRDHGQDPRGKP